MSKLIYLAARNASLTPESFVARWRQHGEFAMSLPMWRHVSRYRQCRVYRQWTLRAPTTSYDGVGEIWNFNDDLWRRPIEADMRDVARLERDEIETFSGVVAPHSLLVTEEIARDGDARTTAYLFAEDQRTRVALTEFSDRLNHDKAVTRLVMNHVEVEEGFAPLVLTYSSILEVSAPSIDVLDGAIVRSGMELADVANLILFTSETFAWACDESRAG